MKNRVSQCMALAIATVVMFSCSTSKQYSKKSFGGGWGEGQIAKKTEQSSTTVSTIETTSELPSVEPIAEVAQTEPIQNTVATPAKTQNVFTTGSKANKTLTTPRELKKTSKLGQVKQLRKATHHVKADDSKLLYIIIALFIPPLAVALYEGSITSHFWISLLLTFLFFIPGLIYSILVILDQIG